MIVAGLDYRRRQVLQPCSPILLIVWRLEGCNDIWDIQARNLSALIAVFRPEYRAMVSHLCKLTSGTLTFRQIPQRSLLDTLDSIGAQICSSLYVARILVRSLRPPCRIL